MTPELLLELKSKNRFEFYPPNAKLAAHNDLPARDQGRILGWFTTKDLGGAFGAHLLELDEHDRTWLRNDGLKDLKNVFRIYYERTGNTTIVRLNAITGTVAYMDNAHYTETNEVRFERATRYKRLMLLDEPRVLVALGLN